MEGMQTEVAAMPELAPGRPMNWRSFGEVSDDETSNSNSMSYIESDDEGKDDNTRKVKQEAKEDKADNSEAVRELRGEIDELNRRINEEFDEKRALQGELESTKYVMNEMRKFIGAPLMYGLMGKSPVGPLADLVARDDLDTSSNVRQIASGGSHSLLLTTEGDVYAWGRGTEGQLGTGDTASFNSATKIVALSKVKMIAASELSSFAVTEMNNVYAWGDNSMGQLGIGDPMSTLEPTLVEGLPEDAEITQIAAGRRHTMFLTDYGEVFSCGAGKDYQNGHKKKDLRTPTVLPFMEEFVITNVAAGGKHTALIVEGSGQDQTQVEPPDSDYKMRVEYLSNRTDTIEKRRNLNMDRTVERFLELQRGAERLKRELSAKDEEGNVVDSATLMDQLNELIMRLKQLQEETSSKNIGQGVGKVVVQQAAPVQEETIVEARLKQLKTQLERAMMENDQDLIKELEGKIESIENPHEETNDEAQQMLDEYEELKQKVESFRSMLQQLQSSSLTALGKANKGGKENPEADPDGMLPEDEDGEEQVMVAGSVRDLIRMSNNMLMELSVKIRDDYENELAVDEEDPTPASLIANLLLENCETRRITNDYTEGILMHTVRKIDDYKDRKNKSKGRSRVGVGGIKLFC